VDKLVYSNLQDIGGFNLKKLFNLFCEKRIKSALTEFNQGAQERFFEFFYRTTSSQSMGGVVVAGGGTGASLVGAEVLGWAVATIVGLGLVW
jgi:hypothetical protein